MAITVKRHSKKCGKKVSDFMRVRGTVFGVKREVTIRYDWRKTVAQKFEILCNEIIDQQSLGDHLSVELQRKIATIKEPKLVDVLNQLGLIDAMNAKDSSVGTFLDAAIDHDASRKRAGLIEQSTLTKRTNACKKFRKAFGDSCDIRKLSYGDLQRYFNQRCEVHSRSLVAGELRILRMYFREAVKEGLILVNPFDDCKVQIDHERIENDRIVIDGDKLDIVEAWLCEHRPDNYYIYWVLLRWTGCRKNEPLHLQWKHIDFDAVDGVGMIDMPSPKTSKKSKKSRKLPMFIGSSLRAVLLAEYERQGQPNGDMYVVQGVCNLKPHDRSKTNWDQCNPNTNLKRLIGRAGVEPWKKTCQNVRVTRENELLLSGQYRPEAVHYFIGHTRKTYESSYASMTESDFAPRVVRNADE